MELSAEVRMTGYGRNAITATSKNGKLICRTIVENKAFFNIEDLLLELSL
jgi:hypothetical protein